MKFSSKSRKGFGKIWWAMVGFIIVLVVVLAVGLFILDIGGKEGKAEKGLEKYESVLASMTFGGNMKEAIKCSYYRCAGIRKSELGVGSTENCGEGISNIKCSGSYYAKYMNDNNKWKFIGNCPYTGKYTCGSEAQARAIKVKLDSRTMISESFWERVADMTCEAKIYGQFSAGINVNAAILDANPDYSNCKTIDGDKTSGFWDSVWCKTAILIMPINKLSKDKGCTEGGCTDDNCGNCKETGIIEEWLKIPNLKKLYTGYTYIYLPEGEYYVWGVGPDEIDKKDATDVIVCENAPSGYGVLCGNGFCDVPTEDCSNCDDCLCGTGELCCDGVCKTPMCSSHLQCDDGNPDTIGTCQNIRTCLAMCSFADIGCNSGECDTTNYYYCNDKDQWTREGYCRYCTFESSGPTCYNVYVEDETISMCSDKVTISKTDDAATLIYGPTGTSLDASLNEIKCFDSLGNEPTHLYNCVYTIEPFDLEVEGGEINWNVFVGCFE